jgi:ferredoxin
MAEKVFRRVIQIDEDKCDGCGQCAEACHEGAIQIIEGKEKLVSDSTATGWETA